MERELITRNQIVNEILKIGHGDLGIYVQVGTRAVQDEPELFAHLIAWNEKKGEVRDSKVALPVIALRGDYDQELFENAVAHLMLLDPRNLMRAVEFHTKIEPITPGARRMLKDAVTTYIRTREENPGWWDRTVLQHRKSMKRLYKFFHIRPNHRAQAVLFKGIRPKGSVFEAVANLKTMSPKVAAGTILNKKIPFLIAVGALGGIKDNREVILALLEQMSGSEVVGNTEMFRRLGVFDDPAMDAAFTAAMERAKADKKTPTLKAKKAADKVKGVKAKAKMKAVTEDKMDQLGGIEGDWLVLGDRSGSMEKSIEIARQVAALIAQQVKGRVELVFFHTQPTRFDVTGKSLAEIEDITRRMNAGGATSIGCGLELIKDMNILVNGIVIISDGGENREPAFLSVYRRYAERMGIEPSVYLLWVPGEQNYFSTECKGQGFPLQEFDVSGMDHHALPNLIKTLRASKFMLVEEIMQTPLVTLADVFKKKEEAA